MNWGTKEEREIKRRIDLSMWAYAYEFLNISLVPDSKYDEVSRQVDLSISTGNDVLDSFFREHFNPSTGMWIRNHPDLHSLHQYTQWRIDMEKTGGKPRKKRVSKTRKLKIENIGAPSSDIYEEFFYSVIDIIVGEEGSARKSDEERVTLILEEAERLLKSRLEDKS